MTEKNVVELNNHEITVESVITRLERHKDKIKSITAIVHWDNETMKVFCDKKGASEFAYELAVLSNLVNKLIDSDTQ